MTWLQLRLETCPDDVAELERLLVATGSVAVTLEDNADQPLLEPGVGETPLWQRTRLTGLYPADSLAVGLPGVDGNLGNSGPTLAILTRIRLPPSLSGLSLSALGAVRNIPGYLDTFAAQDPKKPSHPHTSVGKDPSARSVLMFHSVQSLDMVAGLNGEILHTRSFPPL